MLTTLLATVPAWFSGAKRWFNGEALKSVSIALAAVVALLGFVLLYLAGGSATEAKVNWRWLHQIATSNVQRAERVARHNKAVADAASLERDTALETLKAVMDSKAKLEAELATLKENPTVFTRDERRRLFKR